VLVHSDLHYANILARPAGALAGEDLTADTGRKDGSTPDASTERRPEGSGAGPTGASAARAPGRAGPDRGSRAGRYVAIDPKPVIGDAEYAVAPMLWNRIDGLSEVAPQADLRLRCAALASAAGLDAGLARDWSVVREVRNALSYLESGSPGDARRSLWVASSLLGRTLPDLPPAHLLAVP
jgi:streptomycin 6-kinase